MGLSFVEGFGCGLQIGKERAEKQAINDECRQEEVHGEHEHEKEFVAPAKGLENGGRRGRVEGHGRVG